MRPVVRGDRPRTESGDPVAFGEYQEARGELIRRIGEYCSYCEQPVQSGIAVEHVQPRSLHPELELEWDNFLLSCVNCNSTKTGKNVVVGNYFWPDRDNTFRAFDYTDGGYVRPSRSLSAEDQARAQRTLDLTGIDRTPAPTPRDSDRRWKHRLAAWDKARRARSLLVANDTPALRESILELARATGFWSVWMSVFMEDQSMRHALIQAVPGTCAASFDASGLPVARPGGAL